jgi:hypothetical protein
MPKSQESWIRSQHPSSDTVESEGRQIKQCWITYTEKIKRRKHSKRKPGTDSVFNKRRAWRPLSCVPRYASLCGMPDQDPHQSENTDLNTPRCQAESGSASKSKFRSCGGSKWSLGGPGRSQWRRDGSKQSHLGSKDKLLQTRITSKSRIRIRIKVKRWIRIHINVMRIRNTVSHRSY